VRDESKQFVAALSVLNILGIYACINTALTEPLITGNVLHNRGRFIIGEGNSVRNMLIILFITLSLTMAGCQSNAQKPKGGSEFDVFKQLKVSRESVPHYEASPRSGSGWREGGPEIHHVWAMVKGKGITEEQSKKIIADFITRHQDKNDYVLIGVADDRFYYVGEFFKNFHAEENYRGPARAAGYPVVYYRKTPAKG